MWLGVDTGGTFTDFVLFDGESLHIHKVLSTPAAPERAILQGLRDLGVPLSALQLIHGSTVATNAALEGKGVRTAFITNHGFADMLTIGRQARRELYHLQPRMVAPPVTAELCLESGGRLAADGGVVEPLTERQLRSLREQLLQLAPQAVAINLLFSFVDDRFERAIEAVVPEGMFVSRSSAILPEYREYERGIATWLNAWVGPLVQGYLSRLQQAVQPAAVTVMQSSAGTIGAQYAGAQAVHMLLSGPAGGLMGARFVAHQAGRERLLTFDMGGTSTDVALIDGEITLTTEGELGGYPVAVPMVDMHTIGAGGGSIARMDGGGLLQVGPQSAGASPGPACYGQGGTAATVTDANLLLGRLRADAFLGGAMRLDVEAARRAMAPLAEALQCTVEQAAAGIVQLANEHMARALRVISVQRGVDPEHFTLVSFGGAGGLHVCALADALGMRHAMVPVHGGVLSALGMLVAPRSRHLSRTVTGLLEAFDLEQLQQHYAQLCAAGREALQQEGIAEDEMETALTMDLRYLGQSYTLNLPWTGGEAPGVATVMENFHQTHERCYGHRLEEPVELVNLRVEISGPTPEIRLPAITGQSAAQPSGEVTLYGHRAGVPLFARDTLAPGQVIAGPALITETVATTFIAEGWQAQLEEYGSLMLTRVGH